jgi:hypothetical protein
MPFSPLLLISLQHVLTSSPAGMLILRQSFITQLVAMEKIHKGSVSR